MSSHCGEPLPNSAFCCRAGRARLAEQRPTLTLDLTATIPLLLSKDDVVTARSSQASWLYDRALLLSFAFDQACSVKYCLSKLSATASPDRSSMDNRLIVIRAFSGPRPDGNKDFVGSRNVIVICRRTFGLSVPDEESACLDLPTLSIPSEITLTCAFSRNSLYTM